MANSLLLNLFGFLQGVTDNIVMQPVAAVLHPIKSITYIIEKTLPLSLHKKPGGADHFQGEDVACNLSALTLIDQHIISFLVTGKLND